jgi:hypothetical protein
MNLQSYYCSKLQAICNALKLCVRKSIYDQDRMICLPV